MTEDLKQKKRGFSLKWKRAFMLMAVNACALILMLFLLAKFGAIEVNVASDLLPLGNAFAVAIMVAFFLSIKVQNSMLKSLPGLVKKAKSILKGSNFNENSFDEFVQLQSLLEEIHFQKSNADEEHDKLNAVMKAFNEILIVVSIEGTIRMVNISCENKLEYTSGELEGQSVQVLFGSTKKWDALLGYNEIMANGMVSKEEVEIRTKTGNKIFVAVSGSAIIRQEKVIGLIFICYDLSARKNLESQLVQAQKLEAIGQLAAGVAHEINTPMQYIGDNTEFLSTCFTEILTLLKKYDALVLAFDERPDELEKDIKKIKEFKEKIDADYLIGEMPEAIAQSKQGIAHVVKIVRSLKAFSHQGGQERQLIDINEAIKNVVTVSKNEWKYVAELVTNLEPNLELLPCFSRELNQVMLNIIVNAAHSIEEKHQEARAKGVITIETRQLKEDLEIRISDTGTGISEEVQKKIFDPFFTTKEVGKGTGQGLSIAHSVIKEQHKGTLNFETNSEGTTFIICLPLKVEEENSETEELKRDIVV